MGRFFVHILFFVALVGFFPAWPDAHGRGAARDTARTLEGVVFSTSLKQRTDLRLEPLSASVMHLDRVEREQVFSLRDFAHSTPNLHFPDYGSAITSSMYVRGLGSRMENPALGLYVDGVPQLNKNGFDTALWDLMRLEVLRGPQSTLYGRNTIGGILAVHTLSPFLYQGTRLRAAYGAGGQGSVQVSTYQKQGDRSAWSLGARLHRQDGFFENQHTGRLCDPGKGADVRVRYLRQVSPAWKWDLALTAGYTDQGGYAYALQDLATGRLQAVAYNDPATYRRFLLQPSLTLSYAGPRWQLRSVTAYQVLADRMQLDQDFTPKSMFTLQQRQREHALNQEFVVRGGDPDSRTWLCGFNLFVKHNRLRAPVRFKEDGIADLILRNVNAGIQTVFPQGAILFEEKEFEIGSRFTTPVVGAALYHQQSWQWGRWGLTAGLRLDYEHSRLDYASAAGLHYRFTLTMPQFKGFESKMAGRERLDYLTLLPKLALQYGLPHRGSLYFSAARGFKAGGFNTQMFSDILQNRMMTDMMTDLGVYFANPALAAYSVHDIITYKPEYSWNLETGLHANPGGGLFSLDAALFAILCTQQQLTVFPPGQTTGRMMTNAGRTRSLGAEVAAEARPLPGLYVGLSWGFTHAVFTRYHNGTQDFRGKALPYVPRHTLSLHARYTWAKPLGGRIDALSLRAGLQGAGKIWWDENNTLAQPLYTLAQASLRVEKGAYALEFWGKNLGDARYRTFYFMSIGHPFFALGKPRTWGATLSIDLPNN